MDFTRPIYAEIWGDTEANKLKGYLSSNGIEFNELPRGLGSPEDLHVFETIMTYEQLREACTNGNCNALYYQ